MDHAKRSEVSNDSGHRNRSDVSSEHTLPLYRKLLLVAAMAGNEICVSFEVLYEVQLLQILGVPVAYVSLYPLVTGPVVMLLLYLMACLSDLGSNHRLRKIAVLVISSVLMITGISLLIWANFLLLSNPGNESTAGNSSHPQGKVAMEDVGSLFLLSQNVTLSETVTSSHAMLQTPSTAEQADAAPSAMPLGAFLGLVGFCLMDMAYDVNSGLMRSCVLACSPAPDHVSVLVLSLAMAGAGGVINSVLGLCDLTNVFTFGNGEKVAIQSTVQLVVCLFLFLTTSTSTVITALLNMKHLDSPPYTSLKNEENTEQKQYGTFPREQGSGHQNRIQHCNSSSMGGLCEEASQSQTDTCRLLAEPPACENRSATDNYQQTDLRLDNTFPNSCPSPTHNAKFSASSSSNKARHSTQSLTEDEFKVALCHSTQILTKDEFEEALCHSTQSLTKDEFEEALCHSTQSLTKDEFEEALCHSTQSLTKDEFEAALCHPTQSLRRHKFNFIIACIASYLGNTVAYSYNLYTADFLGKAVLGGDSAAPLGSAELQAYEDGLSIAAGGLLLFCCCYLVLGTVHGRILKFWGVKVQFCLCALLMATGILGFTLTKQVALYYVDCVLVSFHRSTMLTVPYIIANDYVNEKNKHTTASSNMGRTVAILACMMPLNVCTLFVINGPFISLTHYDGFPLLLASVATYLSAAIFLLYRP